MSIDIFIPTTNISVQMTINTHGSLSNATYTDILWTTENFNEYNLWAASTPAYITVPEDGVYRVNANINFFGNSNGSRGIALYVNDVFKFVKFDSPQLAIEYPMSIDTMFNLNADDNVKVRGYQASGGDLAINPFTSRNWFEVFKVE